MSCRRLLALFLAVALGGSLSACGGGSSSSSAGGPTTTAPAAPSASPVASLAAERRAAGRAAPFVDPEADNSVPTFGSEAGPSQRRRAEAVLRAYLRARAGRDWPSACTQLSAVVREGFEKLSRRPGATCAQILAALSKGSDLADPLTGHLLSLRVSGGNAFALFYAPHRQQYIVPMAREGQAWKVSQAAPIAYPPGATPTSP
jgi:hypothetical protein